MREHVVLGVVLGLVVAGAAAEAQDAMTAFLHRVPAAELVGTPDGPRAYRRLCFTEPQELGSHVLVVEAVDPGRVAAGGLMPVDGVGSIGAGGWAVTRIEAYSVQGWGWVPVIVGLNVGNETEPTCYRLGALNARVRLYRLEIGRFP